MKKLKSNLLSIISVVFILLHFQSCTPKYKDDYEKKCLELDLKMKELDYLNELYLVKNNIEFEDKIRILDSLINDAVNLN